MPSKPQDAGEAGSLRLLLLRHAKSAWPEGVADEERPLNGRGRAAARLMGDYLAKERLIPDLALVSTALRTQETWAAARERLPRKPEMRSEGALYAASPERMLSVLRAAGHGPKTVLMLAHNPGKQELALALSGPDSDALSRQAVAEKYSTAGLAVIDFAVSEWRDVEAGGGRLVRFVTPRSLV